MTAPAPASASGSLPLCVDLDGTLLAGDTLLESLLELLRRDPRALLRLPLWASGGRARLKQEIARRIDVDPRRLPFRADVVAFVRAASAGGRRVVLATAADARIATAIAAHLGVFDDVLASDGRVNLKGQRKAAALVERFGHRGFVYAGDARADLPVWEHAAAAVVVGGDPQLRSAVARRASIEAELGGPVPGRAAALLRLARPHQWIKNALLFVPLLTAQRFDRPDAWFVCGLAALAMCFVAGAMYALNDVVDLPADRQHRAKRARPLASGELLPATALTFATGMLLAGGLVAAALPPAFGIWLAAYAILAAGYSLWMKRVPAVDVVVLAMLYTLRIEQGAAAIGVPASGWLLAFSGLLFGSLALLKRYVELADVDSVRPIPGRGYRRTALPALRAAGLATATLATLLIGAYVSSAEAMRFYRIPAWLWGLAPLVGLWLARAWRAALRGTMHEDPVVHALRDPVSYGVVAAMIALAALAR